MSKKSLLVLLLILGGAVPCRANGPFLPDGMQRIKGDGFSYFIAPPLGWVLDLESAKSADSDAVLYPKGTHYDNAPSVLYTSAFVPAKGKKLEELIAEDLNLSRAQNPGLSMEKGPTLYTRFQKPVPLRYYSGFKDGHLEAAAYLAEADVIVTFVLSSSDQQVFNEDLPALQALVASYEFMPEEDQGPALGWGPKTPVFPGEIPHLMKPASNPRMSLGSPSHPFRMVFFLSFRGNSGMMAASFGPQDRKDENFY